MEQNIFMASNDYSRLNLLFVDDDPVIRLHLREILKKSDWSHAVIVGSVAAAFDAISDSPPDMVFTDLQMPGENGLDLIRAIRDLSVSPDPLVPVFLLTGSGDADHVRAGQDAGAAGFLLKPITLARITDRVIDEVTRQRPFVMSPDYTGPERRYVGRPDSHERRNPLAPGTLVFPPDGLLLAKVGGDPDAIREAQRRRTDGIIRIRQALCSPGVTDGENPRMNGAFSFHP